MMGRAESDLYHFESRIWEMSPNKYLLVKEWMKEWMIWALFILKDKIRPQ